MEINEWDEEEGYHMGVFLCIGQHHHGLTYNDAMQIKDLTIISKKVTENIEHYLNNVEDKIWFWRSKHKIKRKLNKLPVKWFRYYRELIR